MRALVQRVSKGSVRVDGRVVGEVGVGYVILLGVGRQDTRAEADQLAAKIVHLRVFADEPGGRFDRSLLDIGGGALVVPQFTLYADSRRGRRPDFTQAARPEVASPLCDHFAARLRELGVGHVATGVFGASMQVEIHNDGPVTIWLDTAER